jgi:transcriptional regulator with XRE-family HTH domain
MWFEDRLELATRRKALGISQARLGAAAGLSRSVVRDVERGRIRLRGERAQRLWVAILDERKRQEQGLNAFAARMRDIDRGLPITLPDAKLSVDAGTLIDLVREVEAQKAQLLELPVLRTQLAEIAQRVNELHDTTQSATAAEGARIIAENAVQDGVMEGD